MVVELLLCFVIIVISDSVTGGSTNHACPCTLQELSLSGAWVCTDCFQKYTGYLCSLTGLFHCDFKSRGMESTCFECSFSSVKWLFFPKLFQLGQNIEGLIPVVLKGTSVCVHIPGAVHGLRICPLSRQMHVRKGRTFTWTRLGLLKASWWIMLLFLPLILSNTVRSLTAFAQCVCFDGQHLI